MNSDCQCKFISTNVKRFDFASVECPKLLLNFVSISQNHKTAYHFNFPEGTTNYNISLSDLNKSCRENNCRTLWTINVLVTVNCAYNSLHFLAQWNIATEQNKWNKY